MLSCTAHATEQCLLAGHETHEPSRAQRIGTAVHREVRTRPLGAPSAGAALARASSFIHSGIQETVTDAFPIKTPFHVATEGGVL